MKTREEIMKEKGIDRSYIHIFPWMANKKDVRLFPREKIDQWSEVRAICDNERDIVEMIDFYYH